jgi:hypothetical protein
MQRKQQVGECWVCVIFFARVVVSVHCTGCGGVEGVAPHIGGSGQHPQKKIFCLGKCVTYLGGFSAHGFLPMVFYFRLRN